MEKLKAESNKCISLILLFSALAFLCHAELVKENYPKRIISLGPAITGGLYLLEVQDKLVGNTIYCERPDDAKSKEKVGTVTEINIEKIITLKPDLVFATELTNPRQIEKLKSLSIKVIAPFSYKNETFTEICENFINLGKLVGKEKKAREIVYNAKGKVTSIQKSVNGLPKPKILVQIGARPLWIATKNSFINDFIELSGGINLGPEGKSGLFSREKAVKINPDIILIVDMGIIGEKEKENWHKYETINAVKKDRIYIIDSYKVCSPTPESFVDALEEIVKLIHIKN